MASQIHLHITNQVEFPNEKNINNLYSPQPCFFGVLYKDQNKIIEHASLAILYDRANKNS